MKIMMKHFYVKKNVKGKNQGGINNGRRNN